MSIKPEALRKVESEALRKQRMGHFAQAIVLWLSILELRADWEGGYGQYYLADCYTRVEELDLAEQCYRSAINISPDDEMFSDALTSLIDARKLGRMPF